MLPVYSNEFLHVFEGTAMKTSYTTAGPLLNNVSKTKLSNYSYLLEYYMTRMSEILTAFTEFTYNRNIR